MTLLDRVYLDNAATSWPKPEAVYRAVDDCQRRLGAPAGRSNYVQAAEVGRLIDSARSGVARLIGAEHARHVIFTCNGTDSLNLAISGLLRPGDHVVTTLAEHNSVLRPLRHWQESAGIEVDRVPVGADGIVDPHEIQARLRDGTRLVVLTHASNVTGALQPADEIARIARRHGAFFLLDAAQTLGHVEIDVASLPVDLLAAPGHKGLLGPLGSGVLYIRPGLESQLKSVRQGGTGSKSEDDHQPDFLPDKYESGNLNAAGIIGLSAGVAYLHERRVAAVREHDLSLTSRLLDGLSAIAGVALYGPRDPQKRVGVVSFNVSPLDPQEVAAMLDAAYRVQVRAGLHCAPLMHQSLGTLSTGGTVRMSLGPFNDEQHVDAAIRAVSEVAASAHG
ncbi:MAG: aminotransferase class V-fold PLP-dependent enzyme [Planctomycetia bacterium]|nr:aminotransferase class V-fold PLP-dependent enzyme [Planctomycetia bacterium]